MESKTPFIGTDRLVKLDAEPAIHVSVPVVVDPWDTELDHSFCLDIFKEGGKGDREPSQSSFLFSFLFKKKEKRKIKLMCVSHVHFNNIWKQVSIGGEALSGCLEMNRVGLPPSK